jgi:hypothetical protein
MNYIKHYNLLIEKAKNRAVPKSIYTEKHHIVPRSEGGSGNSSNIVKLYPREHFLAHWLLYRQNPESISRAFAFNMMSCDRRGTYKPSSRAYAEGVEAAAKANKENFTGRKLITRQGKCKYVKPYEIDFYLELGWIQGGRRELHNKGRFWSNNGLEESFGRELQPGWSRGRLTKGTTKGKKAISKDGEVKFVDSPEEWVTQGWKLGNEKYYPGYLHLSRNEKNRPENWMKE